ncbi:MAG: calcium-binding protein [Frankiales bacterium]|nr:calcium-binding protein [Frankiales bacterium]
MTGYARSEFGSAWTDDNLSPGGHNGCDTRNDILTRDLTGAVIKNCAVQAGALHDPYTGKVISFVRGAVSSDAVQIDHVVALGDAWQTGAQSWSAVMRVALANDPLNLLAVDGLTNQAKGDADAASWLPPSKTYRCAYVARQVAVKARYGLWMTSAEHDAIARILQACPQQRAPAEAGRPAAAPASGQSATSNVNVPSTASSATVTAANQTPTPSTRDSSPPLYYPNCAAVRTAGKAPLQRGDPGYRVGLDGDRDGTACE